MEVSDKKNWEPIWKAEDQFPASRIDQSIKDCLLHRGSLTQYLRQITNQTIQFRLKDSGWEHPHLEESSILNIKPQDSVWVREIEFNHEGAVWVAARMVIPQTSLTGEGKILQEIGDRPMGEILFSDPTLSRSKFTFCQLPQNHLYYREMVDGVFETPPVLWSRRSVLHFHQKPLLVIEIFFPALFEFLQTATDLI